MFGFGVIIQFGAPPNLSPPQKKIVDYEYRVLLNITISATAVELITNSVSFLDIINRINLYAINICFDQT